MSAAPLNCRYEAFAYSRRAEILLQRATETFLRALPLISTLAMKFGSEEAFGAGYNVLPMWRVRPPNEDHGLVYAMSYLDVADTPTVLDVPPGLQGILLDFWQRPIPGPTIRGRGHCGDVGFSGPDGGSGGKFLIVPPGYDQRNPSGHYVYRSGTNNVFAFLYASCQDEKDLAPAVALMKTVKIYPLGETSPKAMIYRDGSGTASAPPRSDSAAFDQLKWLLDHEGEDLADPDAMDLLAGIGIVRGEPFTPTLEMRAILDRAARSAVALLP